MSHSCGASDSLPLSPSRFLSLPLSPSHALSLSPSPSVFLERGMPEGQSADRTCLHSNSFCKLLTPY